MGIKCLLVLAAIGSSQYAMAAETVTYTYDAMGRVVKVVRSGPANNSTDYQLDKAGNRVRVKTS
jgi:hypothetical protein